MDFYRKESFEYRSRIHILLARAIAPRSVHIWKGRIFEIAPLVI